MSNCSALGFPVYAAFRKAYRATFQIINWAAEHPAKRDAEYTAELAADELSIYAAVGAPFLAPKHAAKLRAFNPTLGTSVSAAEHTTKHKAEHAAQLPADEISVFAAVCTAHVAAITCAIASTELYAVDTA
jgi:hypothetical protein